MMIDKQVTCDRCGTTAVLDSDLIEFDLVPEEWIRLDLFEYRPEEAERDLSSVDSHELCPACASIFKHFMRGLP